MERNVIDDHGDETVNGHAGGEKATKEEKVTVQGGRAGAFDPAAQARTRRQ